MEAKDFQALVEQLGELTAGQRDALVEAIKRKFSVKDVLAPSRRLVCDTQTLSDVSTGDVPSDVEIGEQALLALSR